MTLLSRFLLMNQTHTKTEQITADFSGSKYFVNNYPINMLLVEQQQQKKYFCFILYYITVPSDFYFELCIISPCSSVLTYVFSVHLISRL